MKKLLITTAASVALLNGANGGVWLVFDGVSPEGPNFRWNYQVQADLGDSYSSGGDLQVGFFNIFGFQASVDFAEVSDSGNQDWNTDDFGGPPGSFDAAAYFDLGPAVSDAENDFGSGYLELGTFSFLSSSNVQVPGEFWWSSDAGSSQPTGQTVVPGELQVAAVPEASTWVSMAAVGLLGACRWYSRRTSK